MFGGLLTPHNDERENARMTCPQCQSTVGRSAFLGASGLSGIVCEACGTKLAATFESRLRLNGGGVLIGISCGFLAQALGAGPWLAVLVAAVALCAWFAFRTETLLVLKPAQQNVPSIQ